MNDVQELVNADSAGKVAERAGDIRRALLQHPDENRPATAGEVAAALALVERLAQIVAAQGAPNGPTEL